MLTQKTSKFESFTDDERISVSVYQDTVQKLYLDISKKDILIKLDMSDKFASIERAGTAVQSWSYEFQRANGLVGGYFNMYNLKDEYTMEVANGNQFYPCKTEFIINISKSNNRIFANMIQSIFKDNIIAIQHYTVGNN